MALMGAATSKRRGGSAAAVLDFAVAQILGDDATLGALPAVLDRMVAAFGLRAALAFQPEQPAVLAVHPPGAADQALLARIGVMAMAQRDSAPVPLAVTLNGQPGSVLVARSVPVEGQCLCALALIGDAAASDDGYWDAETRASAQAVAAIVATQIRHANDMAALAERQVLTRALIAGAPVAMLAMDADVRLVEFNPAAERLSGYRRGDVLGQPMTEILVPERDRPRFLEHIKTYLATGDPEEFTGQLRVAILRADGTERVAELTPVQITLGGQAIFAGFLRDLTELERLLVRLTAREVSVGGTPVTLTPTEFRLLAALIRHPGQTLAPDQLLKLAWNDPFGVGPDRVKFGVMRLRRKLGQGAGEPGAAIEAVRGFGYKYVPPG
jgi:PAS domain S-box-containing protein